MASRLWDWAVFEPYAATNAAKIVRLSGESLALFLSTEELTEIGHWRVGVEPPDTTDQDTIEALVALAYEELMVSPLIGTIQPFATATPPAGMLECDGATYLRTDYPDLYAALDTPFIVDADHFVTPDLRSRVLVAAGSGTGLTTYAPGDAGGEETHVLTTAELAAHNHGITDLGHTHTVASAGPNVTTIGPGAPQPTAVPLPAVTGLSGTGISIQNAGSNTPHENRQPYLALRVGIWAI